MQNRYQLQTAAFLAVFRGPNDTPACPPVAAPLLHFRWLPLSRVPLNMQCDRALCNCSRTVHSLSSEAAAAAAMAEAGGEVLRCCNALLASVAATSCGLLLATLLGSLGLVRGLAGGA